MANALDPAPNIQFFNAMPAPYLETSRKATQTAADILAKRLRSYHPFYMELERPAPGVGCPRPGGETKAESDRG